MEEDWNTGVVTYANHSIKRCEPEDFGNDDQSDQLYELWISDDYEFDIFCPDLEKNEIQLYSQEGENFVQSMIF